MYNNYDMLEVLSENQSWDSDISCMKNEIIGATDFILDHIMYSN